MASVQLDRAQREAIRQEIRLLVTGVKDVELAVQPDRDGHTDRAFVVQKIAQMQQWVAALDAVGWQESVDGPDEVEVPVDHDLEMWARGQAVEIEASFRDLYVVDEDLDALTGLRRIAGVA